MSLSPNCYPNREHVDYFGRPVKGKPEIIVLHMTEGSFESAKNWLTNPASQASCSVLISKNGEMIQLVDDEDAPWTNGFSKNQKVPPTNKWVLEHYWNKVSPNLYTLSIEMEWFAKDGVVPVDSPLYNATLQKVAEWCIKYNIPPTRERIMGHWEINPAGKPFCGKHVPWEQFMKDLQNLANKKKEEIPLPGQPFKDITSKHEWALNSLIRMYQRGLISGRTPDRFDPDAPLTRLEAVVLLDRVVEYVLSQVGKK